MRIHETIAFDKKKILVALGMLFKWTYGTFLPENTQIFEYH